MLAPKLQMLKLSRQVKLLEAAEAAAAAVGWLVEQVLLSRSTVVET